jgi:phosphate transport system permease protein
MAQVTQALPRPKQAPWQRRNLKNIVLITLASVLPSLLAIAITVAFSIDGAIGLVAVFLPIQILATVAVGQYLYKKRGRQDAVLMIFTIFFSTLVVVLLTSVLVSVFQRGAAMMRLSFISQNATYISSTTSLDYGGLGHAMLGSLAIVGFTTLVTVPLGVGVAIYLTESRSGSRGIVRSLIQSMSGLPSVVSGMFIYSALIVTGVSHQIGLTGSLALIPLMLPTVARVCEEALRLVPGDLRSAALGLGAPSYRMFLQVVLPAARTGIITAVLLGVARVIGETAPLLLTVNAAANTNLNIFDGPIETLPTFLFRNLSYGTDNSIQRAWGAALVVLFLVLIIFTLARTVGGDKKVAKPKKRK